MATPDVVTQEAMAAPILILGAQRSGTTWLAKIIDSHPDVLYRHEPDEALPAPVPLSAESLPPLLARWITARDVRAVSIKPLFRKSFQPAWTISGRTAICAALKAAGRLPSPLRWVAGLPVPDLASRKAPHVAIKSIRWAEGSAVLARSLPLSRTVFILRHPCGQVASVMRGNQQRRFDLRTEGTDMPFDEATAVAFAATFGIDDPGFQSLPSAAKYAWSWRAFNEPTYADLAALPNVHVVLYEALCARPDALARRILAFAGLDWNLQTEDFVARSSAHAGSAGYYAVFRNAAAAAENWRKTMSEADQQAVRSVMAASPLARFWPDLVGTE
jgi:hypothetical protein